MQGLHQPSPEHPQNHRTAKRSPKGSVLWPQEHTGSAVVPHGGRLSAQRPCCTRTGPRTSFRTISFPPPGNTRSAVTLQRPTGTVSNGPRMASNAPDGFHSCPATWKALDLLRHHQLRGRGAHGPEPAPFPGRRRFMAPREHGMGSDASCMGYINPLQSTYKTTGPRNWVRTFTFYGPKRTRDAPWCPVKALRPPPPEHLQNHRTGQRTPD